MTSRSFLGSYTCSGALDNKTWIATASVPVCSAVPCSTNPPNITNGAFNNCNGTIVGGSCTPSCAVNFVTTGAFSCVAANSSAGETLSKWVWTPLSTAKPGAAECSSIPCETTPASIPYGKIPGSCIGGLLQTNCTPVCDENFSLRGVYTCSPPSGNQNASYWAGAPVCLSDSCVNIALPLPASNMAIPQICKYTLNGMPCNVTCESNYQPVGNLRCNAPTGVVGASPLSFWTGTPKCITSRCTMSPNPNYTFVNSGLGYHINSCVNNTKNGETCTAATCAPTSSWQVKGSLICTAPLDNSTGTISTWVGAPFCQSTGCNSSPPPAIPNSADFSIQCLGTLNGKTCTPQCNTGFQLFQGGFRCQAPTGNNIYSTWVNSSVSGSPYCSGVSCVNNPPAVTNAGTMSCSGALNGANCTPVCNANYMLSGVYTCSPSPSGSQWIGAPTCVSTACTTLPSPPLNGVNSACTSTTLNGLKCSPTWSANYSNLSSFFTCNAPVGSATQSTWSGTPKCLSTSCTTATPPANPANGFFNPACANTLNGGLCPPTCSGNYTPSGSYTCIAPNVAGTSTVSTWSGAPLCLSVLCPSSSSIPTNGFAQSCATLIDGSSCVPGCNAGYALSGSYTCGGLAGSKRWTGNAICTPIPCTTDLNLNIPPSVPYASIPLSCNATAVTFIHQQLLL